MPPMRRALLSAALVALFSRLCVAAAPATTDVILHTELGDIRIALETERAPITANNFLHYVDAGRFDGTTFYRALKTLDDGSEGLVQGGLRGDRRNVFLPIPLESTVTTGLSHVDGAISMAHGVNPISARGDFFIVVGGLRLYDGVPNGGDPGYAVFGHVVQGMNIVRRMMRMPRSNEARSESMKGQMLAAPVKILSARRVSAGPAKD
jgi:peptidyl-prolyl cis-trans isomerase A (cyclophilin A)